MGLASFSALAKQIRTDHAVYGIRAKGIDGVGAPFERVEDMAAFYLDSLRELQPHGPYILVGYSFGGLVALEMAQRLSEEKQTSPYWPCQALADVTVLVKCTHYWRSLHEIRPRAHYMKKMHGFPARSGSEYRECYRRRQNEPLEKYNNGVNPGRMVPGFSEQTGQSVT